MNQPISRKDLCGYLSLLRKELAERELFPAPNVIFLNSRALYHHLAKQPCGDDTIGGILQKIETCIPLAVTEESFSLFLSACREPKTERTRTFLESSKADFLLMVHQTAKDDMQWAALTALCEKLRQRNIQI
ncbi:MAG: hypothetical protein IKT48_01680 [Anaerotignum sp.]|nr:hypothetical protein [Anaerotignum sp.]MBR5793069.1 hypothetical protein [Anaerotignum sp.]